MTDHTCPACHATVAPTDQFCESCGATLSATSTTAGASADQAFHPDDAPKTHRVEPPSPGGARTQPQEVGSVRPPCAACGGEVDEHRWCTVCGLRAPSERDHWVEQPAPWVGAVCDRGIRHARNEDAMATAADAEAGSFCALVVCDGVTTAAASDVASLAAAKAALEVLTTDRAAIDDASPASRITQWTQRIEAASSAANRAASEVAATVPPDAEPPSCTFVVAVLDETFVVAGWVGDSRAYWLPDDGQPVQLSVDDSWATDQIALGMPRDAAEADSRAHSITRWLGADSDGQPARCSSVPVDGAGWLLACSDGLWNYCSDATDLRSRIAAAASAHGDDPAKIADSLVAFANESGGHDNITAAVARVPSPASPTTASPTPTASD